MLCKHKRGACINALEILLWALAMFYCLFMVCRILRRETQTEA